jgi:crossover junction endodeoxyribonuclease RuvC
VVILGIDPGFAITGYGIIEKSGSKLKMVDFGAIQTSPKISFSKRLFSISLELDHILSEFRPDCMAIEELFFSKNVKTAINVAHARGVVLLSGEHHNIPMHSYTPNQIKSGVSGYGSATKQQVQYMVQKLLNLKEKPTPDDAADGLAIAICHAHSARIRSL